METETTENDPHFRLVSKVELVERVIAKQREEIKKLDKTNDHLRIELRNLNVEDPTDQPIEENPFGSGREGEKGHGKLQRGVRGLIKQVKRKVLLSNPFSKKFDRNKRVQDWDHTDVVLYMKEVGMHKTRAMDWVLQCKVNGLKFISRSVDDWTSSSEIFSGRVQEVWFVANFLYLKEFSHCPPNCFEFVFRKIVNFTQPQFSCGFKRVYKEFLEICPNNGVFFSRNDLKDSSIQLCLMDPNMELLPSRVVSFTQTHFNTLTPFLILGSNIVVKWGANGRVSIEKTNELYKHFVIGRVPEVKAGAMVFVKRVSGVIMEYNSKFLYGVSNSNDPVKIYRNAMNFVDDVLAAFAVDLNSSSSQSALSFSGISSLHRSERLDYGMIDFCLQRLREDGSIGAGVVVNPKFREFFPDVFHNIELWTHQDITHEYECIDEENSLSVVMKKVELTHIGFENHKELDYFIQLVNSMGKLQQYFPFTSRVLKVIHVMFVCREKWSRLKVFEALQQKKKKVAGHLHAGVCEFEGSKEFFKVFRKLNKDGSKTMKRFKEIPWTFGK